MSMTRGAIVMPLAAQDIIQTLISRHKLTIPELAEKLGVTPRTIYRIKKGRNTSYKLLAELIEIYCFYEEKMNQ